MNHPSTWNDATIGVKRMVLEVRLARALSGILCLFFALLVSNVYAQEGERPLPEGERIAQFQDARDLALDDRGTVYVLDAEMAAVTRIDAGRLDRQALMVDDTDGSNFTEPVSLDPTNGLRIIVADAGRRELQWYSRSFRLLETRILVPSIGRKDSRSGYGRSERTELEQGGRPTAVVSAVTGELFAIDGDEGVIYFWDASGRLEDIIGRGGRGRSVDPVDLAVAGDLLFVADAGRESVLVYDRFGSFVRMIALDRAEDVRAVSSFRGELYITLSDRVLTYSYRGRLGRQFTAELDGPLVDCVRTDDAFYVLTRTELRKLPTP